MDVSDLGEVELRLKENGVAIPARVLSEGTLRLLGLLSLTGADTPPSLIGFEEPENGVHPRRIELIAELLKTLSGIGHSQFIVTTHSPLLADRLPEHSLFVVRRLDRESQIIPLSTWGPLWLQDDVSSALDDRSSSIPVSARILRGDFDT